MNLPSFLMPMLKPLIPEAEKAMFDALEQIKHESPLKSGEIKYSILVYENQSKFRLRVVTLAANDKGEILVNRTLKEFDLKDLISQVL